MTSETDARVWLRANGHRAIAEKIDRIMESWRKRGAKTRRNWWDVLAGTRKGVAKTVEGVTFPVLGAARRRKGWAGAETRPQKSASTAVEPPHAVQRGAEVHNKLPSVTSSSSQRGSAPQIPTLIVKNFAQLQAVTIPLADLVVLVGPQATGKSLVLELLKLVIDRNRIVRVLKQHGFNWDNGQEFSSLYFGGGFGKSWTAQTEVVFDGASIGLDDVAKARQYKGEDAVFYIPAHRTLAIAEGWPRSFAAYQVETPYVARRFSEELLTSLNQGLVGKGRIFPHDRRLKDSFRKLIDDAVFHGAVLKLHTLEMRKQFVLEYADGDARLPFMAWTAGQREFTPLLLGLYHLLPAGGSPKRKEVQWAILEEPEMGLHPKAIVAVMAVVLDLLARGYKVALSTHSPTVLEVVWGMSRLKNVPDGAARLCRMMGLPEKEHKVLQAASDALERSLAVVHLQHDGGRVSSKDISGLDPGAADRREWEWGGLTGFSTIVSEVISKARPARSK